MTMVSRRLAIVAVVSATLLSGCSRGTPPPPSSASSPGTSSPTTSARPQSPATHTSTRAGATRPRLDPAVRDAIATPKPGRYTYDVKETAPNAAGQPTTRRYTQEATIDPAVVREDGLSVEIRTTSETSDLVTGEVYLYHDRGVDLLFADSCALDRPAQHFRFPLRIDARWPSPRVCEGRSDGGTSVVTKRRLVAVGSERVDCFGVERRATDGTTATTKTQWYSPRYRIVVRSELETTTEGVTRNYAQMIRSLTPA